MSDLPLRAQTIRLAASLPKGSSGRRALLNVLAAGDISSQVARLAGTPDIRGDYGGLKRVIQEQSDSIAGALDGSSGGDAESMEDAVAGLDDIILFVKAWRQKLLKSNLS